MFQLINQAYGVYNKERKFSEIHSDTQKKMLMRRLVQTKVERGSIPRDTVRGLVESVPKIVGKAAEEWGMVSSGVLHVACAGLNFLYTEEKGESAMELSLNTQSRGFQYGRLLALYEWIEESVRFSSGKKGVTVAARNWSAFVHRPQHTAAIIKERLVSAYLSRATSGAKARFDILEQEIIGNIAGLTDVQDRPLSDDYLFGYSLQKKALWAKRASADEQEENE